MLLRVAHLLLLGLYLILPVAAVAWAVRRQRKGFQGAVPTVTVVFVVGLAVAVALNLIYAKGTHGRPSMGQVLIGAYFATAMLLLLRLFDAGLREGLARVAKLKGGQHGFWRGVRFFVASMTRVCILFALGLPYVIGNLAVFRAKVQPLDNPQSRLSLNYERVEFTTDDGVKIVGWWIPAQSSRPRAIADTFGTETVLVCHGMLGNKSNPLGLAKRLVPGGMNVLAFDFRGHGESGGQLSGFGAIERLDVHAAVRWLRATHPAEATRIFGVGASTGAAALVSAAADRSDEGQAIAAIAAYAPFDDLWDLARDETNQIFAPPMNSLLLRLGLPVASATVGADLVHYSPARDVAKVWPRPVLLIGGERDEIIPIERGKALLDAASQPKYHIWFPEGGHNDILGNDAAARIVLEFFRRARAVPVI